MFRATTPKHTFVFDVDPDATFKEILVTYAQEGKVVLEKEKEDMTFGEQLNDQGDTEYLASLKLTQEETNLFNTRISKNVTIQVRVLTVDDEAVAFNKIQIPLHDVLNDKVLS